MSGAAFGTGLILAEEGYSSKRNVHKNILSQCQPFIIFNSTYINSFVNSSLPCDILINSRPIHYATRRFCILNKLVSRVRARGILSLDFNISVSNSSYLSHLLAVFSLVRKNNHYGLKPLFCFLLLFLENQKTINCQISLALRSSILHFFPLGKMHLDKNVFVQFETG